jgi:hypothetical protein
MKQKVVYEAFEVKFFWSETMAGSFFSFKIFEEQDGGF